MQNSPLASAQELAAQGLSVFPVHRNKAPACPHGFRDATADLGAVEALWRGYPASLIGVPTGAVNGFDALDVDPRHGGNEWLDRHRDRLPPTRTHRTRSGGWHILFRHHEGVRNSAGRIAPGIDVRGDGGAIIWWPATGRGVENADTLAPWPAWLLPVMLPPPPLPRSAEIPAGSYGDRYVEAAIRRAVEHVAMAGEGGRNSTLNAEAFALARFIKAGTITASDLAEAMATAGLAAGLAPREIQATITSAFRAGGVA